MNAVRHLLSEDTVAILASGPSLTQDDVDYLRGRCVVLAINDGYRIAPWAQYHYAADYTWWKYHAPAVKASRGLERSWTCDADAARDFGLQHFAHRQAQGLADEVEVRGNCSGEHAIHMAWHLLRPWRVILLGYDMGATGHRHWFGAHPPGVVNGADFKTMCASFPRLAQDLAAEGVEVVNATPVSALTCFRRADLRRCL